MNNFNNKIISLGCRLNIFESEVIKSHLKKNKLENLSIINSCAVTAEAEKKVAYEIRKIKKKFPNNTIIVTGCAAQIDPKKYAAIQDVDLVLGNKEKLEKQTWYNLNYNEKIQVDNIFKTLTTQNNNIENFEGKSRAFIEIQQGCDHRCTFCIIPFGRGNNRSVSVEEIVDRIKIFVKNGYKEVVLTGVDITDYGIDLPGKPNLSQLIKKILHLVPNLMQLRLSSIDCAEITEDFWDLLSERRLMPHFHLSLQSGNNLILKRMKRRHTREQAIAFCNKVKSLRPEVTFGADIIAGFPTENEIMFKDSLSLIDECNLTHLHIFPYSQRENTPASRMPQINKKIIKERARKLREKGKKNLITYLLNKIDNKDYVLIESSSSQKSFGKNKHFVKVQVNQKIREGSIIPCIYTGISNDVLLAKRA